MKISTLKKLVLAAACCLTMALATFSAMADKIHLKDGRVLEGKIERNEGGVIVLVMTVDGKQVKEYLNSDDVIKIVVSDPKPADPVPAAAPKDDAKAKPADKASDKPAEKEKSTADKPKDKKEPKTLTGRATRIAILNFGAPRSWQGAIGDTVGIEISSEAWRRAIPLLEKDKVDVVVVRINSGGGMLSEMEPFQNTFERGYKPRFRTVMWIESSISCAAMSPWPIEEIYMMPEGNIGACTGWSGNLVAMKGFQLEVVLARMEETSRMAKRDPKIMRSMQIQEPLSANIDEDGNVTWFQDLSGKYVVNRPNEILTFNAKDAVKFKFAKGIAATKEELATVMGYSEVEWVGKEASDLIDQNMRDNDRTSKRINEVYAKYNMALQAARQLRGPANKQLRGQEIGNARRALNEMKRWMDTNPNFYMMYVPREWFDEQEQILKELARD